VPQTQSRPALAVQQQVRQAEVRREGLATRLRESRQWRAPLRSSRSTPTTIGTIRTDSILRRSYLHARYYDRPDLIAHTNHHVYTYYDSFHHLRHRIIWPTYYYPVYYPFGPHAYFSYVWPYYHRKYVFVSLGGWWPSDYFYMRYYWYGYHPYVWYGYYPTAYEVPAENNYYYTYNYYGSDGTQTSVQSNQPIDQSSWADVRAKLEQQKAQPAAQTLADTRFEEAVKSFEAGNYGVAANQFAEAMTLAPNDVILPFAYAQALFANQQYAEAAKVLRAALQKVTPDKEGVFFPRGLYANDDVLFAQVEKLVDQADRSEDNSDLQLLLGYQLLGVGETGYAREPLEQAAQDPKNAEAARTLLQLLEKVESQAGAANKTEAGDVQAGSVPKAEPAAPAGTAATVAPQTPTTAGAQLSATPESEKPAAPSVPSDQLSAGVKEEQATPDKAAQPAGDKDEGGTPPLPQGSLDSGVVGDSGTPPAEGVAEASLGFLPTVRPSVGSILSYASLGLLTFLGSLAVGMQWRHINDAPVRSPFGRGA
jgi:thioredoxin-like negative regulator of GroEL